jgi:sugar phosphate isomerase/epimerase
VSLDPERAFLPVRIAVLTVSDTRGPEDDRSGDLLAERLTAAGHVLADRAWTRDDQPAIEARLRTWIADPGIDAVISTGGTGLTGRDTQEPSRMRAIMDACGHSSVGVCWNCNPPDVKGGTVKPSFDLLGPFIKNVHINELTNEYAAEGRYPYREFFGLLRKSGYDSYLLAEVAESKEPERFLDFYRALFLELNRP